MNRIMLLSMTLFVVLSKVHQSLQQGIITQMISASYKNIEVEYDSWIKASLYENKTLLTVKRPSNVMCASLCTADELCNAYHFNKTSFCTLGNAAKLVGVSPASKEKEIIRVYTIAALAPGKSSATKLHSAGLFQWEVRNIFGILDPFPALVCIWDITA